MRPTLPEADRTDAIGRNHLTTRDYLGMSVNGTITCS